MKIKTIYRFLYIGFIGSALNVTAQEKGWHQLDLKKDGVFGISSARALEELLKNRQPKPVIVGVIDSGVDSLHEDLRNVLYKSITEIPGNRKDDDRNGYADDIGGWSFIGSEKENVSWDNLELTRLVRRDREYFSGMDTLKLKAKDLGAWKAHKERSAKLKEKLAEASRNYQQLKDVLAQKEQFIAATGKVSPSLEDIKAYQPKDSLEVQVKQTLLQELPRYRNFAELREKNLKQLEAVKTTGDRRYNTEFDSRSIVGDDYSNPNERIYGCPDFTGPDADHGTHVAGIIAADRLNGIGIKGIAANVWILPVRVVPDGDERDKDVANAIRYAVNRGAKVINMSFGKAYSSDKKVVDKAVKYAMRHDVLLVHAAGNDNKDLDQEQSFPNRRYATSKKMAKAWIEVGASNKDGLKAFFSNYGKTSVDVFAPGVKINSTAPGSKYQEMMGTSMAAPVVAGLAALIRQYYPSLKATEVKEIIMQSVHKIDQPVSKYKNDKSISLPFSEICISGGIVNAWNAVLLADQRVSCRGRGWSSLSNL